MSDKPDNPVALRPGVVGPWAVLAGSLAFVVCGGWAAVSADNWGDRAAGVAVVLFFGIGVVVAVHRLRRQRPRFIGVPRKLPAEGRAERWFHDWQAGENAFTEAERAFLDELRLAARWLPAGGVRSFAERDAGDGVEAVVAVQDHTTVFRFALHLSGGRLHGDLLGHEPVPLDGVAAGVRWVDWVLRRPVERLEWWCGGRVCAARYRFADTREAIADLVEAGWEIKGEPDAVVAVRAQGCYLETPRLPRMTRFTMSTTGR
ncbi:hypothetical protein [Dactylosporangium sp. CA-139066]|uniref:hypothetical protein n=1 Tax=Dactylosporangium sp. CA-139066 TaxID=3239930 RepID=UPI003D8B71AD